MRSEVEMADFDLDHRARLAYDRFKWLAALSSAFVVLLTIFLDTLNTFPASQELLVMALIGLSFTLFISIGVLIVASAADRWLTQESTSPAILVWEWRLVAIAPCLSWSASC
jgi:hypothetical protein